MDGERLTRLLTAVLVPLGVVMLLLGVLLGDYVVVAIGAMVSIVGGLSFRSVGRQWTTEGGLSTSPTFGASLLGLGHVLVLFVLLTYVVSDFESVTRAVRAGVPSRGRLPSVGILMGIVLGGRLPALVRRRNSFERLNQSFPARVIRVAVTAVAYVLLLLAQPVAGVIYVVVYSVSRIGVLVGTYASSRR